MLCVGRRGGVFTVVSLSWCCRGVVLVVIYCIGFEVAFLRRWCLGGSFGLQCSRRWCLACCVLASFCGDVFVAVLLPCFFVVASLWWFCVGVFVVVFLGWVFVGGGGGGCNVFALVPLVWCSFWWRQLWWKFEGCVFGGAVWMMIILVVFVWWWLLCF